MLYEWKSEDESARGLHPLCGHHGHILALHLKVRGDFLLVGDLMRSMSLLQFKPATSTIEELARDYNANWMTAIEMFDDDTFIGAEHTNNLFTVKRAADAATDEERARLDTVGEYHLGEFVNR